MFLPATSASGLTRSGSYFDPAADWTRASWVWFPETTVGVTYYTAWGIGDAFVVTSGFLLRLQGMLDSAVFSAVLQVYVGGLLGGTLVGTVTAARWTHVAVRYVASTTTLSLLVDGTVVDTLVIDLTALVPGAVEAGAWDGNSGSLPSALAYDRVWQAALTDEEIATEMITRTVVRTADLLADTPLADDLLDVSGNSADWSLTGTADSLGGPLVDVIDPVWSTQR